MNKKNIIVYIVSIIGTLVITSLAVWFFLLGGSYNPSISSDFLPIEQDIDEVLRARSVSDSVKEGDYATAVETYNTKVNSSNYAFTDSSTKARDFFNVSGAFFKNSGDIEDMKMVIRGYKDIVLDTSVPTKQRVKVLNALATTYCGAGRDSKVLDTIYSGADFQKYYVPGQPGLSSRKMLEWSYEMYPTSRSAIGISHWYAKELIGDNKPTGTLRTDYVKKAEFFLTQADALIEGELGQGGTRPSRKQHASFRYWRAFTIGALALAEGGEYKDQYKKEFTDMVSFIESKNNHLTYDYLPFAHWLYAAFLIEIDGDKVLASNHLSKSVELVINDPVEKTNGLVTFIKNETGRDDGDWIWSSIGSMRKVSPEFDIFVREIELANQQ